MCTPKYVQFKVTVQERKVALQGAAFALCCEDTSLCVPQWSPSERGVYCGSWPVLAYLEVSPRKQESVLY